MTETTRRLVLPHYPRPTRTEPPMSAATITTVTMVTTTTVAVTATTRRYSETGSG